jgi:hypothetical protein
MSKVQTRKNLKPYIERWCAWKIECGNCGNTISWSDDRKMTDAEVQKIAFKDGWRVLFDDDKLDGFYPICPTCIKHDFEPVWKRMKLANVP